jgi:hypothetical protein
MRDDGVMGEVGGEIERENRFITHQHPSCWYVARTQTLALLHMFRYYLGVANCVQYYVKHTMRHAMLLG